MRCNLCHVEAGWFRRRCRACAALWAIYEGRPEGTGLKELLDLFEATAAAPEQVEAFLRSDPDGKGSIQDQLAADMANQLLQALGRDGGQTRQEVKRLRARGFWKSYGQRPPE